MAKSATLTAVAVTFLMVAPAAAASWMSYGTFEPDTAYDTAQYMQQDAPGTVVSKLYFNAFPKHLTFGANGAAVNLNVGALGTRFDPPTDVTSYQAILGVWTDCNGDGYVGMLETAVREYKSELLGDDTLCPPQSGNIGRWSQGQNNYNGWVSEFIPVGGRDYTPNDDKRVYADPEAMVWGDSGRPESAATVGAAGCPTSPLPGDSRTTGGLIRTIDCRGNRGFVAQFNEVDETLGTGLGFEDPANPQNSGSPLNVGTFGDDGSEHSAFYLQDCSSAPLLTTGDVPAGDDVDNVQIIRLPPANPINNDVNSWTVPGTVNATREGATFLHQTNSSAEPGSHPNGNCDYSDDAGNDFYGLIEANAVINQNDGKRNAQLNFRFNTQSRGTLPATAVGAGSAGVPTDLGIDALGAGCTASSCVQSMWFGVSFLAQTPPVFRGDVTEGSVEIAAARHWSFFAYVGSATTARGFTTPGGVSKYGQAQCGSFTSGLHNGWNCDPEQWYLTADGTNSETNSPRPLARVGQLFNFRDVDCWDGRAGDTGLGISPAFFGSDPCGGA